jgi:hypothetical protein
MRGIAYKADGLIALHVSEDHDACAAITGEDDQDLDLVVATLSARWKNVWIPVSKWPQQHQQASSGWRGNPHHHTQDLYVLLSCQVRQSGHVLRGRLPVAGKQSWSTGRRSPCQDSSSPPPRLRPPPSFISCLLRLTYSCQESFTAAQKLQGAAYVYMQAPLVLPALLLVCHCPCHV